MTSYVLKALADAGIPHVHLDTSDHREVGNVGRLDARNIWLALRHWRTMAGLVRANPPRLVYLPIAQGTLGFLRDSLLFSVARGQRIPVIVHLHGASFGQFYSRTGILMRGLIRSCMGQAVCAIVLGDSLRGVFSGLVEAEKVAVLPNGVPMPAQFLESSERKESENVLFLSNLSASKGYLDVIEAAAIVIRRRARASFHIAGEWPSRSEQRAAVATVESRGLADNVIFHGAVSGLRKWELYSQCNVFVFPPRHLEGQPVVILEAMSHGLPVVSTPQGGIIDVVIPGQTGLLVPPQDPRALAIAINSLLEDGSLRARMGRSGRELYAAKFTAEAFQRNLADIMSGSHSQSEVCRVPVGAT